MEVAQIRLPFELMTYYRSMRGLKGANLAEVIRRALYETMERWQVEEKQHVAKYGKVSPGVGVTKPTAPAQLHAPLHEFQCDPVPQPVNPAQSAFLPVSSREISKIRELAPWAGIVKPVEGGVRVWAEGGYELWTKENPDENH